MEQRYIVLRAFTVLLKVLAVVVVALSIVGLVMSIVGVSQLPSLIPDNPSPSDLAPGAQLPMPPLTGIPEVDRMAQSMRDLYYQPIPVREIATPFVGLLVIAAIVQTVIALFYGIAMWALADYLSMKMIQAKDIGEMARLMRQSAGYRPGPAAYTQYATPGVNSGDLPGPPQGRYWNAGPGALERQPADPRLNPPSPRLRKR